MLLGYESDRCWVETECSSTQYEELDISIELLYVYVEEYYLSISDEDIAT